jgi:hypothetical protein
VSTEAFKSPRAWRCSSVVRLVVGVLALAGGGFWMWNDNRNPISGVLFGTGLVLAVEGWTAVDREIRDGRKALDETRRVIYMALAAQANHQPTSHETAGTVANALAHHYRRFGTGEAESLAYMLADGSEDTRMQWYIDELLGSLKDITDELRDRSSRSSPPARAPDSQADRDGAA